MDMYINQLYDFLISNYKVITILFYIAIFGTLVTLRQGERVPMPSVSLNLGLHDPNAVDEDEIDMNSVTLEHVPRIAGRIAADCRNELHISKYTMANKLVVREWILRRMRQMNMREVDQRKVLPFALYYSFIPTKYELMARQDTLSYTYQYGMMMAQTRIKRTRTWWEWITGAAEVAEPEFISA